MTKEENKGFMSQTEDKAVKGRKGLGVGEGGEGWSDCVGGWEGTGWGGCEER